MDTALRLQTLGMVLRNSDYTPQKYLLWYVLEEFQYLQFNTINVGSVYLAIIQRRVLSGACCTDVRLYTLQITLGTDQRVLVELWHC